MPYRTQNTGCRRSKTFLDEGLIVFDPWESGLRGLIESATLVGTMTAEAQATRPEKKTIMGNVVTRTKI